MVVAFSYVRPSIRQAEMQDLRGAWHAIHLPLIHFNPQRLQAHLRFALHVPSASSQTTFVLTARDHIDSFSVNGERIAVVTGAQLPLRQYLHVGDNAVETTLSITTNPPLMVFAMEPSLWHWQSITLLMTCFFVFVLWILYLRSTGLLSFQPPVLFITLFGIALRILYMFSTPSFLRSYDAQGHVEYIQFLLTHLRLPLAGELWQGHQAPFFYILSLPFALTARVFAFDHSMSSVLLQILPLLLSVATLLVGVSIIVRSFTGSLRILGTLCIASFPALIYLSSQVSNDALIALLGFFWFGALLRAISLHHLRPWFLVGIVCGLGLLTKANALPWVIISAILMVCSTRSWSHRLQKVSIMGASAFIVGGWWYVYRFLSGGSISLVANAFQQVSTVILTPTIRKIFTFNPVAILLHPSPSASDPLTRSAYFLETLFRSSQVGSLHFSNTAILLVFAMILLVIALYGSYRDVRENRFTYSLMILLFIASVLLFRLQYPFAVSQHFRYIVPAVLPFTFLLLHGIRVIRPRFLRIIAEATVGVYVLMVTVIVLSVAYYA